MPKPRQFLLGGATAHSPVSIDYAKLVWVRWGKFKWSLLSLHVERLYSVVGMITTHKMGTKRSAKILVVVILAFFAVAIFVPVVRLDTNVLPVCVRDRTPCLLAIQTPITGHAVYWSLTAYYLGWATYLVAFTALGFIL